MKKLSGQMDGATRMRIAALAVAAVAGLFAVGAIDATGRVLDGSVIALVQVMACASMTFAVAALAALTLMESERC